MRGREAAVSQGDVPGTDAERSVVEELARLVLEQAAPEELVLFEETSAEYFADPDRVLDPRAGTRPSDSVSTWPC